jgi:HAD superfamily phosphoserine phosphatase-like hydrolase
MKKKKMIIFDMDNTLLKGRFIFRAADNFGFTDRLEEIMVSGAEPQDRTMLIARLMEGIALKDIVSVADAIPVVRDAAEVIGELKRRGYAAGIISDSYDIVAELVLLKTGADFSIANRLVIRDGSASGEVEIHPYFSRSGDGVCDHKFCKSFAMARAAGERGISPADVIAVGDSANDFCMIKNAGTGVAFRAEDKLLRAAADRIIDEESFKPILDFA